MKRTMASISSNKMSNVLLGLLSASVLATFGTIFYHFVDTSYETETAIRATADEAVVFQGVYVRDENVLTYSGTGAVSYRISDGGKVAVGDVIAEIYPDESAIEQKQQIDTLQEKLDTLQRISSPGTLEQAQPADLSRQATQYYKDIVKGREQESLRSVSASRQKFLEALSMYQIVVSKGAISFDSQIADLNAQIQTLQASQSQAVGDVVSDASAYFVSHVDGFESQLNEESLSDMTPEKLNDIIQEASKGSNVSADGVIGKTVSNYDWYMLGVIDNTDLKYQVGDSVTLRLISTGAEAPATIQELRSTGTDGKVLAVVSCETMTSDFVQNRTERVEMIRGEFEVEETTTDEKTGEEKTETVNCRGVYVLDGEKVEFRRLDVIYEGKDYVLSSLNAGDGYLIQYDSIIVEGIDADGN